MILAFDGICIIDADTAPKRAAPILAAGTEGATGGPRTAVHESDGVPHVDPWTARQLYAARGASRESSALADA